MSCGLYTDDELIQKLKDINDDLDDAISKSKLDTGQSEHEVSQSLRVLREQYEKYLLMLKRQNPAKYRCIAGAPAIQYRGGRC